MSIWKKRTKSELDSSVNEGDYTGGYKFGPWLLWMRFSYIIGLLANIFASVSGWKIYIQESDNIGLVVGIFFGLSSALIIYKLRKDYINSKKGISK